MQNNAFISLGQARRLPILQRDGRGPDLTTLWRWCLHGVRGGAIKLASWQIGRLRVTTEQAVREFLAALNSAPLPDAGEQRQARAKAAQARLAKVGI